MINQLSINGIPLTNDEVKAIQLALQNEIEIIVDGTREHGHKLNDEAIELSNYILGCCKTALSKIATTHNKFYPLSKEEPTEEDIKQFIK